MKVIVHIGTEKTGTTSIQQYLHQNKRILSNAGYYYLHSAGRQDSRALPSYCIGDEKIDDFFLAEGISTLEEKEKFKQSFIKKFDKELHSLPRNIHTVVISSEHFHSRIKTEAEMDNVYALLSPYFDEIKIICYLREQVVTCISYYSTHLKSNGKLSFARFLEKCKPADSYYNYQLMLENWERCFGIESLDVSLFAKERFLNNSLLDDFTAKIDKSLVGKLNRNLRIENESLKPAGQALARVVNLVFPLQSELPEVADIRDKCRMLIVQNMKGNGQQPDMKTWESTRKRFVDSNEQVRQKYFPNVEKLFADPVEVEPAKDIIGTEFSNFLASIVALIKKHKVEAFMPDVYLRLWSAVSTCVTDTADAEGVDFNVGPPPVVLTKKDARLLKHAAEKVEKEAPRIALRLMTLASRIKPMLPGIQKKLKQYRQGGGSHTQKVPVKSEFLVTYRGGNEVLDKERMDEMSARWSKWLQSLDIASGSAMVPVKDTNIIKPDGVSVKGNSSGQKGYTMFYADSLEEAITIAKGCPHLQIGGTLEVSEIVALLQ